MQFIDCYGASKHRNILAFTANFDGGFMFKRALTASVLCLQETGGRWGTRRVSKNSRRCTQSKKSRSRSFRRKSDSMHAATPPQFRVFYRQDVNRSATHYHSHNQGQPLFANVHSCSSTLLHSNFPLLDTPPLLTIYCGLHSMASFLSYCRNVSQWLLGGR